MASPTSPTGSHYVTLWHKGNNQVQLPDQLRKSGLRKVWEHFCAVSLPMLASSTGTGLLRRYVKEIPVPAAICAPALGVVAFGLIIHCIKERRAKQQEASRNLSPHNSEMGEPKNRCSQVAKAAFVCLQSAVPVFAASSLTEVMETYSTIPLAASILCPPVAFSILTALGLALKSHWDARSDVTDGIRTPPYEYDAQNTDERRPPGSCFPSSVDTTAGDIDQMESVGLDEDQNPQ